MSAAEVLIRLLAALLFWLTGVAILLPALGDRRGLVAAGALVAVGTASMAVALVWQPRRDRGDQ